ERQGQGQERVLQVRGMMTASGKPENRRMRRIGHRGASGHAPDNTIPSFEAALALGCDEVETDVWLAGDGRLVISHDPPAAGSLHPNRAFVTPELVRDAHVASLRVNVWTVNEPGEIAAFAGWGVDGIMSDYPERVPKP